MKVPTEDEASLFLVQVWASLQTCFFHQQDWEPAVTVIACLCPQCFKWQLGSRPVRISKRGLSFITSQKKFGGGGCYPWSSLVGSDLGLDIQVRSEDHSFISCRNLLFHSCGMEVVSSCSPGFLPWLPSLPSTWLNIWSFSLLRTSTPASLPSLPGYSQGAWYIQIWVARQCYGEVFVLGECVIHVVCVHVHGYAYVSVCVCVCVCVCV